MMNQLASHLIIFLSLIRFAYFEAGINFPLFKARRTTQRNQLECERDEFMCHDGRRCIPIARLCDRQKDCIDNSDEHDCQDKCSGDDFRCENKKCIDRNWVCDSFDDCGDNSDEKTCLGRVRWPCSKRHHRCHGGQCVPMSVFCDGKVDCPRGEDEHNCQRIKSTKISTPVSSTISTPINSSPVTRHSRIFHFQSTSRPTSTLSADEYWRSNLWQIRTTVKTTQPPEPKAPYALDDTPNSWSKNTSEDDDDNIDLIDDDEEDEREINRRLEGKFLIVEPVTQSIFDMTRNSSTATPIQCEKGQFKCNNQSRCISAKSRCDGIDDCDDKSDERDCSSSVCSYGVFRCKEQRCIISSWLCNATDWAEKRKSIDSQYFKNFL